MHAGREGVLTAMFTTLCDVRSSSFLVLLGHLLLGPNLHLKCCHRSVCVEETSCMWGAVLSWLLASMGVLERVPQVQGGTYHLIPLPQSWLAAFVT